MTSSLFRTCFKCDDKFEEDEEEAVMEPDDAMFELSESENSNDRISHQIEPQARNYPLRRLERRVARRYTTKTFLCSSIWILITDQDSPASLWKTVFVWEVLEEEERIENEVKEILKKLEHGMQTDKKEKLIVDKVGEYTNKIASLFDEDPAAVRISNFIPGKWARLNFYVVLDVSQSFFSFLCFSEKLLRTLTGVDTYIYIYIY